MTFLQIRHLVISFASVSTSTSAMQEHADANYRFSKSSRWTFNILNANVAQAMVFHGPHLSHLAPPGRLL
jgi:hypothetical protein